MNGELQLEAMVDAFTIAMKKKLLLKSRSGWKGWNHKRFIESGKCKRKLLAHVMQLITNDFPEEIDIANFAMFIWQYKRSHK